MPNAAPQIPVTVLTGCLGSGKTTLLNRMLSEAHGKRFAVIVNEFGEVGSDNDLIVDADEGIFEMNDGCICCTVRGDLIRIIEAESGFLPEEHDHEHDERIGSLSLVSDRPMKPNRFVSWIQDVTQRYGTDLLRMKGIASIEDDERLFVVQSVHMLIEGGSRRPWKEREPRRTRLVFIGRDLPKDLLRQGFETRYA
jgi:G3E family GTPase